MNIKQTFLLLLIAAVSAIFLALPHSAALSEEQVQDPFYIGEIIIESETTDYEVEDILDQPVQTTVIRREDFEDRFTTLPEVLAEQAGVQIKSQGGLGSFSTVSIRGISSNKVLIMLDGVPLNLGLGGEVNLGDLPLKNLERVEIYKGHVPAEFGMSSIGGVVNLVTRKASGGADGDITLSVGDYDTRTADLFLRSAIGKVDYTLSLVKRESDGDFEYLNNLGTPYNASDDVWMSRLNNWFKDFHFVTNMEYGFGTDRKLTFGDRYSTKSQGIPGPGTSPSLYTTLKTKNHLLDLRYKDPGAFGTNTETGLEFQWHTYETKFQDLYTNSGEIGLGRQDNRNTTTQSTVGTTFKTYYGLNHEVSGSVRFSKEHYQPRDRTQLLEVGRSSRRKTWASRISYNYRTTDDAVLATLDLGREDVRSTINDDSLTSWNLNTETVDKESLSDYHVGLRWHVSSRSILKANYGKYYRLPSFYELFGDRGGVIGNFSLVPERGKNWDLGISWSFGNSKHSGLLDFTYFDQDVNNVIVFIQTAYVAKAINLDSARVRGTETTLDLSISSHWNFSANHTWQDTENDGSQAISNGKKLPGRYEDSSNLKLEWNYRRVRIYNSLDFASETYLNESNFDKVDSREVYNAGVNYSYKNWVLSTDVKNINDNTISDINGFPLPGRSWFFSAKRSF